MKSANPLKSKHHLHCREIRNIRSLLIHDHSSHGMLSRRRISIGSLRECLNRFETLSESAVDVPRYCLFSKEMSSSTSVPAENQDTLTPERLTDGTFVFKDFPEFQPNRSPEEILRAGSFGGTYFRPIKSSVCPGVKFGDEVWKELPQSWIRGLDPRSQLCSSIYRASMNKYKVKSGASLEEWEQSGWIRPQDPYGWFQWYCRFFQGRRTEDDGRQVARWVACAGERSGRWRNRLCKVVFQNGTTYNDPSSSPVIRQTLLHWAYELTQEHYFKWGANQGAEIDSDPKHPSSSSQATKKVHATMAQKTSAARNASSQRKKRVARKMSASKAKDQVEDSTEDLTEGKPVSDEEHEDENTGRPGKQNGKRARQTRQR